MAKEPPAAPIEPAREKDAAAAPLWKKVLKTALYVSSALIAPVTFERGRLPRLSWGKAAIFLGVPLLAMPLAANLFPTAEEVLTQKGYPAAMVQDLAPDRDNIRVRPDNTWGKAHAFFSSPPILTLIGKKTTWSMMHDPQVLGLARAGGGSTPDIIYVAEGRIQALYAAGQPPRAMTQQDEWLHTYLHEVRHVSEGNKSLMVELAREADSDYEAARVMIKHLDRPDFAEHILSYKGNRFSASHDTALYLSARFNGAVAPAVQDMAAANVQAGQAYGELSGGDMTNFTSAVDCHLNEKSRLPCQFTAQGTPLSDLARQRLGMYFNSYVDKMRMISAADVLPPAEEAAPKPPQNSTPPKPTS
ncbi:MAG: hypothetical protein Q8K65_10220 [Alphaproteobacteria bacterium]|nr:hypothetical protein [Alphaproteobacteria bacterium]